MRKVVKDFDRIVVKVGTSTLTHSTGLVNIRRFHDLVRVLSDIKNSGKELILVSSGAMAIGRGKLNIRQKPDDMPTNQATAAVGQGELMHLYDTLFGEYYHIAAQVLLTKDVVDDGDRLKLVTDTFHRLIELGCIPIVNENDTVSTEEIEFGDNDTLSAVVADICGAQALVILTDIDGFYNCDPRSNPEARLLSHVPEITDEIIACAAGAGSDRGTGGMTTKIHAAQYAANRGIHTFIINGKNPEDLYRLMDGEALGTHFTP